MGYSSRRGGLLINAQMEVYVGGLIIPGVQVSVVKEVLPRQLAPSGVLGIVGFTERSLPGKRTARASSWNLFRETFGPATARSMPEARQALDNGVYQLVIAPLSSDAGSIAKTTVSVASGNEIEVLARVPGTWANGIVVNVTTRLDRKQQKVCDITLNSGNGDLLERHRGMNSPQSLAKALEASTVVRMSEADGAGFPKDGNYLLKGGQDATPEAYRNALEHLNSEPDVDMVLASVQDFSVDKHGDVLEVYNAVVEHCQRMSSETCGRLGLGQVPPTGIEPTTFVSHLRSERFIVVAPHGVVGAVAGRIGDLGYYESPTFKSLVGAGSVATLSVEEQRALLQAGIAPVVLDRERGVIILRGITTDGDQINVRRIADRAVRTLKMIGDRFIGRLNTADGRDALKQKLIEALLQMVRDGALVPSTDGTDPPFKVDVYSSQQDFALGVVRVDMAVRPVRAIDYIYATVLVQV